MAMSPRVPAMAAMAMGLLVVEKAVLAVATGLVRVGAAAVEAAGLEVMAADWRGGRQAATLVVAMAVETTAEDSMGEAVTRVVQKAAATPGWA